MVLAGRRLRTRRRLGMDECLEPDHCQPMWRHAYAYAHTGAHTNAYAHAGSDAYAYAGTHPDSCGRHRWCERVDHA